jgi:hypothetical protein
MQRAFTGFHEFLAAGTKQQLDLHIASEIRIAPQGSFKYRKRYMRQELLLLLN